MITADTTYNVTNRSSSIVVYKIPEDGIRREFAIGETKRIKFGELEKLTFQEGGREILEDFLQITEDEVGNSLNLKREPEYYLNEAGVRQLLLEGSLDEFLDALDYAPIGVLDLIKAMSVTLPLTNIEKRRALKDVTGFDVDRAISNLEAEKAEEKTASTPQASGRRVTKTEEAPAAPTGRRTAPKYNVVEKKSE